MSEYNHPESPQDWHPEQEKKPGIVERALDKPRQWVNKVVAESKLHPEGRESTVGIYGGKIKDEDGKAVYDMRGFISNVDRLGDERLRAMDDHIMKEPVKMALKHPKAFLRSISSRGKRFRTFDAQRIDEFYKKFGLDEYYAGHPHGIEIKRPEILSRGYNLQDVYKMPELGIDRFAAAGEAARYLRQLHDKGNGGLGDVVVMDFQFQKKQGDKVTEPVIFIPNTIYDSEKITSPIDQKATDLMELITSVGIEEFKRSQNWDEAKRAVKTILENYHTEADDKSEKPSVVAITKSFLKRGRMTLPGDEEAIDKSRRGSKLSSIIRKPAALHNTQHMQVQAEQSVRLKEILTQSLEEFLADKKSEI